MSSEITRTKGGFASEFDIHIWNDNFQLFGRAKSEAKMAALGGIFCTSLSVVLAVLYVSSSPLQVFSNLFVFSSTSKTFPSMEIEFRSNRSIPILHNRVFNRIQNCCVG